MPHITLRSDLFGITSLLDYRPQTAAPICELTDLLLRGDSTLTQAERELIATHVSYLNDCTFCQNAHSAVACQLPGMTIEQIEALKNDPDNMPVSAKMQALLQIAAKVQQSGRLVTTADVAAARHCGATDLEIHDTVLISALFCLYNRYVDGLATAVPNNPAYYEALGKRINGRGYSMPSDGYHALAAE